MARLLLQDPHHLAALCTQAAAQGVSPWVGEDSPAADPALGEALDTVTAIYCIPVACLGSLFIPCPLVPSEGGCTGRCLTLPNNPNMAELQGESHLPARVLRHFQRHEVSP